MNPDKATSSSGSSSRADAAPPETTLLPWSTTCDDLDERPPATNPYANASAPPLLVPDEQLVQQHDDGRAASTSLFPPASTTSTSSSSAQPPPPPPAEHAGAAGPASRTTPQVAASDERQATDEVEEEDHPSEFLCPISRELMADPVVAEDGQTYDRQSIQDWFSLGHSSSPVTREEISPNNLIPNRAVRSLIEDYCEKKGIAKPIPPAPNRPATTRSPGFLQTLAQHLFNTGGAGQGQQQPPPPAPVQQRYLPTNGQTTTAATSSSSSSGVPGRPPHPMPSFAYPSSYGPPVPSPPPQPSHLLGHHHGGGMTIQQTIPASQVTILHSGGPGPSIAASPTQVSLLPATQGGAVGATISVTTSSGAGGASTTTTWGTANRNATNNSQHLYTGPLVPVGLTADPRNPQRILVRQWQAGRQDGHPQAKLWKCVGTWYGSREEIVARLREGADINYYGQLCSWGDPAEDRFGYRKNFTLLHNAVIHGRAKTAKVLLELNANIEGSVAPTADAPTPLQAAVCWRQPNLVRLLLHNGANHEVLWCPLEYSLAHRSMENVARILSVVGMLFKNERSCLEFCEDEIKQLHLKNAQNRPGSTSNATLRDWVDIQECVAARVNGTLQFEYSVEDQSSCCIS
ncbi:unnamed protein product [Amoebophrya sp. A120]|nr:unnamed protein product [Amoebophrya sp. A120]|eukprot:GSA120T00018744001.1